MAKIVIGNRATLKLVFIGFLSLTMLIPLVMVYNIITDRQNMQSSAQQTIASRWGGAQTVGGLVALSRSEMVVTTDRRQAKQLAWHANVLPSLSIVARMKTEIRYLGIYDIPVYTTQINISGHIDWSRFDEEQATDDLVFWLPLGDVRGVREVSTLKLEGLEIPAKPLQTGTGSSTGLQFTLPAGDREKAGDQYELDIKLAGSESLMFLPLADTTQVTMDSSWPHPEFVGQFLPIERSISADGVKANWQMLGLNRPFGDRWQLDQLPIEQLNLSAFGMRLETPVDVYQQSERSVKYGFLFIALTFLVMFLFEVMTDRPVHPVSYVLTGAALSVFYLVLLALSEYLSFGFAFMLAAGLLLIIVTPYASAVLGGKKHGLLLGGMLLLTYLLLYVLVSAQHAALLLGSFSLLAAIAALMFLTRTVDWYAYGEAVESGHPGLSS